MTHNLAIVTCFLLLITTSQVKAEASFKVGTAIGSITPTTAQLLSTDYFMGGYGFWKDRGPARGTHDLLTVRTVCIEVDTAVCLVVLDSLGIPGPLATQIKQTAAIQSGVPADNILISATHTHAAPDLLGLWGGSPASYRASIIDEVAATVASAYHGRVASNLTFAEGTGKAHNRRGWEFTDDDLGLLAIHDPGDETLLGAIVFFAAHPVISPMENHELSSDFVHYLREELTTKLNAPIIYFNGAIGDVNPSEQREDDFWPAADAYGKALANQVTALIHKLEPLQPTLTLDRETVRFPVENTTLNIAGLLGLLDANTKGPFWDRSIDANLNLLTIGSQLNIVTLPGEATTRLGLTLKRQLPGDYAVIIGQTEDSLGYMIPRDEWQTGRNGNYEETVSLGISSAPLVIEGLQNLVIRLEESVPQVESTQ